MNAKWINLLKFYTTQLIKGEKGGKVTLMKLDKKMSFLLIVFLLLACSRKENETINQNDKSSGYGVFLSLQEEEVIKKSEGYDMVVIDGQYLSKEKITFMKERGQKVYSYLNVGSLETFRSYFDEYSYLRLKPYKDWKEEYWTDVSNKEWLAFIKDTLIKQLLEKEVDGFWVDNVDVYSQFPHTETYLNMEKILKEVRGQNKPVIINSGIEFVLRYMEENKNLDDILTGVNQETVFSTIHFESHTFGTQTKKEHSYYMNYLNKINEKKKEIYLLEYTTNNQLIKKINRYARKRGWGFYISDSIELNGE